MRRRLVYWFLPAAFGFATVLVFSGGVAVALTGKLGHPPGDLVAPAPTPAPKALGTVRIVAVGDSLTRGNGDNAGGYPARVAETLRKAGKKVDVVNLGVDGYETSDLLKKLALPDVKRQLGEADLILLSISGNDLTHSVPRGGGSGPEAAVLALGKSRENLKQILGAVREANAKAPVRLLGLYNPFPGDGPERRFTRGVLLQWNLAIEESSLTVAAAVVVPTADLFEERPDRLSSDRFHPGPAGYGEIAARVVSTLPSTLSGS